MNSVELREIVPEALPFISDFQFTNVHGFVALLLE
jgi:hypothetical protein